MTLEEAISISTQAADVQGIPSAMLPVVRRKVPAGYVADIRKRKKRKKKNDSKKRN